MCNRAFPARVPIHERVWEQSSRRPAPPPEFRPTMSYTLLGVLAAVFVLELLLRNVPVPYRGGVASATYYGFIINTDWPLRPWTLVTSTLAHAPDTITHLLFNGLFLFFFGPMVERIIGPKRFLALFLLTGAVSGVAQVHLSQALGHGSAGALGASGALMALFGVVMVLMPREKILVYGIVPVPMWAAGIGYALLDVLGVLNPYSPVGNIAHLAGMALGLGYGVHLRQDFRRRGLRLVRG